MEEALCSKIGMEFQSEDEAYNFYNKYGLVVGFSVRKDYLNKDKNGVITLKRYICCKEGFKPRYKGDVKLKRTRTETKTGCETKMGIILNRETMKYQVQDLVIEHNHTLHIAECTHMMRSQRKVSISQGPQSEIANDAGISLKQSHELMGKEASGLGNIGYIRDDLKRYLQTKRERGLKYGEAGAMLRYFEEQKLENPSLFHAEQLDCEEQITNIFWADASMLMDYTYFRDVVTFDTTYKTNKEYRPLGVFVGFNQFRQLDAAMAATISAVMPSTYHGLCTFHIRVNFMKHLGNYYKDGSNLPYKFAECMHEIEDENEFIMTWDAMLKEHKLETNEWLCGIYACRKKWAKCFMKGAWTAVVDEKRYNELRAEYHSRQKLPMMGLQQTPVLIQAASIYSPCMFVAFQNEYDESTTMVILDQKHTTMYVECSVSHYDGGRERRVILNPITKDITCSCNLFEQEGILCSHALKVYDMVGTKFIPDHYVTKKWTKKARSRGNVDCKGREISSDPSLSISRRYRLLAPKIVRLAIRAAMSEAATKLVSSSFSESNFGSSPVIYSDIQSCRMSGEAGITPQILSAHNIRIQDRNNLPLLLPNDPVSKTKYTGFTEFLMTPIVDSVERSKSRTFMQLSDEKVQLPTI
nr:protein FAR1-RELATED SEQUENCE 5-like [Coffea arabica]